MVVAYCAPYCTKSSKSSSDAVYNAVGCDIDTANDRKGRSALMEIG